MEPQQPMEGAPTPAPEQPMQPTPAPEPMSAAPQPMTTPQPVASATTADPGKGLGIASLVTALLGMGLVGLILGIIGNSKSKKAGHKNGLAVAGIVISIISMIVGLIVGGVLILAAIGLSAKCADLGPGTHVENGTTYTCPAN